MLRKIQYLLPNFRGKALAESVPVLSLLFPMAFSAILPETLEVRFALGIGVFKFLLPYILSFFLLPIILSRPVPFSKALLFFAVFFLFAGIASMIYGEIPVSGIVYGSFISMLFLIGSKISCSDNDTRFVFWITLTVLIGLALQTILLSLGLVSISVDSGFGTLGVEGEISRISTTVGAATGSSAMVFLLGVLCFYSSLQLFKNRILPVTILFIIAVALLLLLTRGGLLMHILFVSLLFVYKSSKFRLPFFMKIMAFIAILGTIFYLLLSNQELMSGLIVRGFGSSAETSLFADNGRYMRYMQAIDYWENHPLIGSGLGSYYHRSPFLRYLPGYSVGLSSPHNVYLLFLAELGIIGFVPFAGAIAGVFFITLKRRNRIFIAALIPLMVVGVNVELIYFETPWLCALVILFAYAIRHFNDGFPTPQRQFGIANHPLRYAERRFR